jgi:hypothetical protein
MTLTPDETAAIARAEARRAEAQRNYDAATPGSPEAFAAAREAIHAAEDLERLRFSCYSAAAIRRGLEEAEEERRRGGEQ